MSSRLVVLVSGTGTNLEALLQACRAPEYGAEVVAVGADRSGIRALDLATGSGISGFVRRVGDYPDRSAWDVALTQATVAHAPDLVVCAGFMKVLGPRFLAEFSGRIINTHPALLPSFPGAHAVRDAIAYGVRVAGCTLHVVDAGVDTGPVIDQRAVSVLDDDDEARLHERIKVVERQMLVEWVGRLVREGWQVTGRRVFVGPRA